MKLLLSQEAMRYLDRERAYLAQFSRRAAAAFSDQIKRASRLIADHPHVGTIVAPVEGIRRFVSAPYHLDYVVRPSYVLIVSIMHARQGPADLEKDVDVETED